MIKPAVVKQADNAGLSGAFSPLTRPSERCPTCGEEIDERFCRVCGERRPSERAYSLKDFAHEVFETVTNVERSFLHTLKTLFRKPGELTAAYMRGERVRYLRPFQLFLLVNVVYFVWAGWSGLNVFNTRFNAQLTEMPYRRQAVEMVRRRLPPGMTQTDYGVVFDQKSLVIARSMIVAMVPMLAVVFGVLAIRKRRPVVQHVVFSLHFFTVLMLLTIVTTLVAAGIVLVWRLVTESASAWQTKDLLAAALTGVGVLVYLVPALRRAYGDGKLAAVLKAFGVIFALLYIITIYRFLLFVTTVALI